MSMQYFRSSIGRKAVMAVTGVFLFGFVVAHMLGNLQIFLGPAALNGYAEHLEELPMLLWPARAFLLLTLIFHILTSISLAVENKQARPVGYAHEATVQASYASRTMVASGILVFVFIVYHLLHFTFCVAHPQYCHLTDSEGREDVYSMVVLSFRNPWIAGVYVAAIAMLSNHLSHGLQSLFQSLGMNNEKTKPLFQKLAIAAALVILIGNSSIVLASFFGYLKLRAGVI